VASGSSISNVVPLRRAAFEHRGVSERGATALGARDRARAVVRRGTGFVQTAVARKITVESCGVTVVARRAPVGIGQVRGARMLQRAAADAAAYDEILQGVSAVVNAVGCLYPNKANANANAKPPPTSITP
jgi:hypothetical protein